MSINYKHAYAIHRRISNTTRIRLFVYQCAYGNVYAHDTNTCITNAYAQTQIDSSAPKHIHITYTYKCIQARTRAYTTWTRLSTEPHSPLIHCLHAKI